MNAKCLSIKYNEGYWGEKVNGIKRRDISNLPSNIHYTGYGWGYQEGCKSELILTVNFNNKNIDIDVADFFKKNFGRLIEKRRNMIKETMPDEITIINKNEILEDDLQAWLQNILNINKQLEDEQKRKEFEKIEREEELKINTQIYFVDGNFKVKTKNLPNFFINNINSEYEYKADSEIRKLLAFLKRSKKEIQYILVKKTIKGQSISNRNREMIIDKLKDFGFKHISFYKEE